MNDISKVNQIQKVLVENFPFFQMYFDEKKIYINVGGVKFRTKSKPADGFLVYLKEKGMWTGHFYGKKFTLPTEELVILLDNAYQICYLTHNHEKVIRKI